jgi:hypothetical protein
MRILAENGHYSALIVKGQGRIVYHVTRPSYLGKGHREKNMRNRGNCPACASQDTPFFGMPGKKCASWSPGFSRNPRENSG